MILSRWSPKIFDLCYCLNKWTSSSIVWLRWSNCLRNSSIWDFPKPPRATDSEHHFTFWNCFHLKYYFIFPQLSLNLVFQACSQMHFYSWRIKWLDSVLVAVSYYQISCCFGLDHPMQYCLCHNWNSYAAVGSQSWFCLVGLVSVNPCLVNSALQSFDLASRTHYFPMAFI